MKEHKKFDDYVKGFFKEDPKVPSELSWESMDFDLPQSENRKKKYGSKYLLLLLLLVGIGTSLFFGLNKNAAVEIIADESVPELNSKELEKQNSQKLEKALIENNTNETKKISTTENTIQTSSISINSTVKTSKQSIATIKESDSKQKGSRLSRIEKLKEEIFEQPFDNKTTKANTALDNVILGDSNRSDDSPISNQRQGKSIRTSVISISTDLQKKSDILSIETLTAIKISALPTPAFPETDFEKNLSFVESRNKEKKEHKLIDELFISYGYHSFDMKVEESNVLKDKVNKVLGNNFLGGVRIRLNQDVNINLLASYDRYHTTFEHTRDLEPRIDLENLRRINIKELTYHNNFTNTVGLQIGVEKKYPIIDKLQYFGGLAISPTYTISSKGKTTSEIQVESLSFDNTINKLSLKGGFNVGLIYALNRSINLRLSYHYDKFLLGEIFLNDGIQATQRNSFLMSLSYRL